MVHRTARGGSGRRPPLKIDDFTRHDPFAAELSLELVGRILHTFGSISDFLRARMLDRSAPLCIQGDPDDEKSFADAKRAMSDRTGVSADVIAEWDLVEFVLVHCLPADGNVGEVRPRLAGLWRASQRYDPPGYHGPVHVPADAPAPIADPAEAPNNAVRVRILEKRLSAAQDDVADLRRQLARRNECEKAAIAIIAGQLKQLESLESPPAADSDLLAENATLRRQIDEMREWHSQRERHIRAELRTKLQAERAAHNLTANRMAAVVALFDAERAGGGADTARLLRRADFPLGMDLYSLLNLPGATERGDSACTLTATPEHTVRRRYLTVYLRSYLITVFGVVPGHADDPAGLYRAIVRDGVLPPMDVLRESLSAHTLTLQFVQPLMDALAVVRSPAPVSEIAPKPGTDHQPALQTPAEVHELGRLGGGHRAGLLDNPVTALDLVSASTRPRRPGNSA